jgi:hypothetical protein
MRRHLVPAVLAATALAATGGAAFALAGSVGTSPAPLYISRTSPDGLSDHPDTTPAAVRAATSTTAVTSTTVPETSTTVTSTPLTAPRSSTTVTSIDDDGGDRVDDNSGRGTDDTQPDDHGGDRVDDNSGHGSDDSGSDDSSGHGSDDSGSDDNSGHGSDD